MCWGGGVNKRGRRMTQEKSVWLPPRQRATLSKTGGPFFWEVAETGEREGGGGHFDRLAEANNGEAGCQEALHHVVHCHIAGRSCQKRPFADGSGSHHVRQQSARLSSPRRPLRSPPSLRLPSHCRLATSLTRHTKRPRPFTPSPVARPEKTSGMVESNPSLPVN